MCESMIVSTFRFNSYMLHKKIIGYYTPTSHRICGFYVDSMRTPQDFEGIIRTFEQIMRSPWEPMGDCNIQRSSILKCHFKTPNIHLITLQSDA